MIALHGFMSSLLLDLHQKHDTSESSDETDATTSSLTDENAVDFIIVNDNARSLPPSSLPGDNHGHGRTIRLIRTTSDRSSDRWQSNCTFSPPSVRGRLDRRSFDRRGRPTSSSSSSSSLKRSPPPPLLRIGGKQHPNKQRGKQVRPDLLAHRAMSDSALVVPRRSKDPPEHYKQLLLERIRELPLQRPLLMVKNSNENDEERGTTQADIVERRAKQQHEEWGYYYYSSTLASQISNRSSYSNITSNETGDRGSRNRNKNYSIASPTNGSRSPRNREFIHTTLDLLLRSLDDDDDVEDDDAIMFRSSSTEEEGAITGEA